MPRCGEERPCGGDVTPPPLTPNPPQLRCKLAAASSATCLPAAGVHGRGEHNERHIRQRVTQVCSVGVCAGRHAGRLCLARRHLFTCPTECMQRPHASAASSDMQGLAITGQTNVTTATPTQHRRAVEFKEAFPVQMCSGDSGISDISDRAGVGTTPFNRGH